MIFDIFRKNKVVAKPVIEVRPKVRSVEQMSLFERDALKKEYDEFIKFIDEQAENDKAEQQIKYQEDHLTCKKCGGTDLINLFKSATNPRSKHKPLFVNKCKKCQHEWEHVDFDPYLHSEYGIAEHVIRFVNMYNKTKDTFEWDRHDINNKFGTREEALENELKRLSTNWYMGQPLRKYLSGRSMALVNYIVERRCKNDEFEMKKWVSNPDRTCLFEFGIKTF